MPARPIRISLALSVAEFNALEWFAIREGIANSALARSLMIQTLKQCLDEVTTEGQRYASDMAAGHHATIHTEKG